MIYIDNTSGVEVEIFRENAVITKTTVSSNQLLVMH